MADAGDGTRSAGSASVRLRLWLQTAVGRADNDKVSRLPTTSLPTTVSRASASTAVMATLLVVSLISVPGGADAATVERSNEIVQRQVIGYSVQGRPIRAYRKGNPNATRKLVVFGQMHGDERGARRTGWYLVAHVPVSLDADVWIVPTLNPDGAARGTRTNARGVDLNRNFPHYWRYHGKGTSTYSGPSAASEPETRAAMRFLDEVRPQWFASYHQPLWGIGKSEDARGFQRRLSDHLGLPIRRFSVCGSDCPPGFPTMTDWYNTHYRGTGITVEFGSRVSETFRNRAARGTLKAMYAY